MCGGPYTMLWLDAMMLQGCTYSCLETVKRRKQRGKQGILQFSVVICKERGGVVHYCSYSARVYRENVIERNNKFSPIVARVHFLCKTFLHPYFSLHIVKYFHPVVRMNYFISVTHPHLDFSLYFFCFVAFICLIVATLQYSRKYCKVLNALDGEGERGLTRGGI